jgi:hypothetical protein
MVGRSTQTSPQTSNIFVGTRCQSATCRTAGRQTAAHANVRTGSHESAFRLAAARHEERPTAEACVADRMINQTLKLALGEVSAEAHEWRMSSALSAQTKSLGAFSMFGIPTFDPVSFAVRGFGIALAVALPFVF